MARASSSDYLQNFRFHVSTVDTPMPTDPIAFRGDAADSPGVGGVAGFQSCSLPEITIEASEYREGTFKYTKKFPGPPSISDVSLMRGVVRKDLAFYNWAVATNSGGEYRATIKIDQFGRGPIGALTPAENATISDTPARTIICYECLPIRVKPGADLDATSGEIAMAECDFALEYFEVVVGE